MGNTRVVVRRDDGRHSTKREEDTNYATDAVKQRFMSCCVTESIRSFILQILCCDTLVFVREATNTTISSGAETLDKSC